MEALTGRKGDRFVTGSPGWVQVLPVAAGAYLAVVTVVGLQGMAQAPGLSTEGLLGLTSAAVFGAIGVVLLRTQMRNRPATGGWSLSGLALLGLFATCAVMHLAVAMETAAQVRRLDVHLVLVDGAGVVASTWFLVVVRALTRDARETWEAVGPATTAAI
jgi:hypothetical protein